MIPNIDLKGGAAFHRDIDTLVVADVHIGLEDALRGDGLDFPLGERDILLESIEELINRYDPGRVVFNGDFLHDFTRLTRATQATVKAIIEAMGDRRTIVVMGSHDTMLNKALEGFDVEVKKRTYSCGRYVFTHGHTLDFPVNDGVEVIVIGHDHPAVDIDLQRENCYLWGTGAWRGLDLLVLPSFSPLTRGVAINGMVRSDFLSPILRGADVGRLRPIIDVGEPLVFPSLAEMRRFLRA